MENQSHDLYKTGDADAPEAIKDRNSEVVLAQCRRCGKAEAELVDDNCTAKDIDAVMATVPARFRNRWCTHQACGCQGCANGYLTRAGFKQADHTAWLFRQRAKKSNLLRKTLFEPWSTIPTDATNGAAPPGEAVPMSTLQRLQEKAKRVVQEWRSHNGSDGAVYLISARALQVCVRLAGLPPAAPIPMLLYCPICGVQHVDAPGMSSEFDEHTWTNPPHRSHLCHNCGCIWRPADVPTTGVQTIETKGKNDNWVVRGEVKPAQPEPRHTSAARDDVLADPLSDFKEGQWWIKELDAFARQDFATHDQKRAVAVVRNLLRAVAAQTYIDGAEPADVLWSELVAAEDAWEAYLGSHPNGDPDGPEGRRLDAAWAAVRATQASAPSVQVVERGLGPLWPNGDRGRGDLPPADDGYVPQFNPSAECSPTLTQCPRCNNPHHACDKGLGGAEPAA